MAVNPYLYAIITDGTETFTLEDGTENHTASEGVIINWSPAVASLRANAMGGAGEYEDVVEEIEISVRGTTKQAVYDAFAKLKRLLDKADAWRRSNGETGSAVLFKWCPSGAETSSIASPLQAAILARVEGDSTGTTRLPSDIPRKGIKYELTGVVLRFLRRGLWLHADETATHNTVTNGDLATLSFGAGLNAESPTKVVVTAASRLYTTPHRIIISQASSDLEIINAENMAGATAYVSASGSSEAARNTNVLRYTPTSTAGQWSNTTTYSSLPSQGRVLAFANVRAAGTGVNYLLQYSINSQTFISMPVLIQGGTARQWVSLGALSYQRLNSITTKNIQVKVTASATSAGVEFLDIDTLVLVSIVSSNSVCTYRGAATSATSAQVTLDHRYLVSPVASFAAQSGSSPSIDYHPTFVDGSPFISTSAATVYGVVLANGSNTTADTWRLASGSTADTGDWTLTRTKGYVTPV